MMKKTNWKSKGKSILEVIKELQSFEDQNLEVRISLDGGKTHYPISIVGKIEGNYAGILNCEKE